MGSVLGRILTVTTFGESHGPGLGVVVDGVPAGLELKQEEIQADLDRRRPGTSDYVSPRREPDQVEVLSGLAGGRTLGSPLALLIRNRDARSGDYADFSRLFRPGQADFTYFAKYGLDPQPGGGRGSGRETAGRVAAGAVARKLLAREGVRVLSYTLAVGGVRAETIDPGFAETDALRCPDPARAKEMAALVDRVREEGDSLGGVVEVVAQGVPAGWGEPVFDKLDAALAGALFSIGAVKGVEIGEGFALAGKRGSEANDQMSAQGFLTNRAGGILGGISTGEPIVARLAVKPTPSISLPQRTVDLEGKERPIEIHGRHDPCLCPRIGPVAEAMTCLVLAEAMLFHHSRYGRGK